jgi:hypothetical protein
MEIKKIIEQFRAEIAKSEEREKADTYSHFEPSKKSKFLQFFSDIVYEQAFRAGIRTAISIIEREEN